MVGAAFFWLTDPRYGWPPLRRAAMTAIDLANEHGGASTGSSGIAGLAIVLLIGLLARTTA